ncbi:MAG: tryptophan transporter [Clostridiales bacterium]|nr:tryptophan transporter [Clostridiales bacterium]
MQLRKTILCAILLAVGFILHQVVPAFAGVTFDIQLSMLFVIIFICMDIKTTFIVSIASGLITALTTKFPGGQIPNMIDKMITGIAVYFLIKLLTKFLNRQVSTVIVGFIGTLLSGTVFLASALIILGRLPAPFTFLFLTVALPTAVANCIITPLLYNIVTASKKITGFEF